MSMVGFILKASYQLSRHHIGPLRLNLVPPLFALACGLIWWKAGVLTGEQTAWIIALCLILLLVTLLARQHGFVIFRRRARPLSPNPPELVPDEKVAIRATGLFGVRDERRYFVEVTADFATMETREHIVMARMLDSRFLVGAPKSDVLLFLPKAPDQLPDVSDALEVIGQADVLVGGVDVGTGIADAGQDGWNAQGLGEGIHRTAASHRGVDHGSLAVDSFRRCHSRLHYRRIQWRPS